MYDYGTCLSSASTKFFGIVTFNNPTSCIVHEEEILNNLKVDRIIIFNLFWPNLFVSKVAELFISVKNENHLHLSVKFFSNVDFVLAGLTWTLLSMSGWNSTQGTTTRSYNSNFTF